MPLAADIFTAIDEDAAVEELYRSGCTDGLPIVLPTPARMDRMLAHSAGLDPDVILGDIGPVGGQVTVEIAAINAIMAGCPPEIFPLVIAAAAAIADPIFDAGPMQITTHPITPFVIVNGPCREMFDVASGVGALGPGFRTNATLGRAVRLLLINVGGAKPGTGDMATLGSPAKFTCCMGEAEERSPFEPLHVSRGFSAQESTVTVIGIEGPHSLIFGYDDADNGADMFLRLLGASLAGPGTNNIYMCKGMVSIILQPLHARILSEAGYNRRDVQERLFDYAACDRALLRRFGGARADMAPGGDVLRVVAQPEDFLIMVGGGDVGAYSTIMPSWCGGENGQIAVTKKVILDEFCEVPDSLRDEATGS